MWVVKMIIFSESSVDRKSQLQTTMQRLTEATEELRNYQKLGEEERERERAKRSMGMRRYLFECF